MISLNYFLLEQLKNPHNILIRNKYYPDGLNEEKVWNYYQKNKKLIINENKNRDLILFLAVNENKIIVKRKIERLNNQNFDKLIHGRVLSIHSTFNQKENFGIIDIDSNNLIKSKEAVKDIYNYFSKDYNLKIRFTGKTSFHILFYFNKLNNITEIKNILKEKIKNSNLLDKYTMLHKRTDKVPNIDLSSNKNNGGYISLHSLSIIGLKCIELNINEIEKFNPEFVKI